MIEMLTDAVLLASIPPFAYLLHLLGGCLAVGPAEVARQGREFTAEHGYRGHLIAIYTAGFLPRDADDGEVSEA